MQMKIEQSVEVTLKMSGDDFKKIMNGLNDYAYAVEKSDEYKRDVGDVYSRLVEISKISGFEW